MEEREGGREWTRLVPMERGDERDEYVVEREGDTEREEYYVVRVEKWLNERRKASGSDG